MWEYSSETIINSNEGNLVGVNDAKVRACLYTKAGVAEAAATAKDGSETLIIDGVQAFLSKYVKSISKYAYRKSEKEVAEITPVLPTTVPGVVRLTVSLREEGRVSSIMQNAYLLHRKPFHFEVAVSASDTVADIIKNLVAVINKSLAMSDFKFFTAAADSASAPTKIVLTAADCHIRFIAKELQLVEVGAAATGSGAKLLGFEDYEVLATGKIATAGDCGAGTVEHLIKDLRIPTNASINPFAADQGGRPIPGGKYDQYMIEYETPRAHVAHGVMGSVGEVSRTSYIIFVEQSGAADVETAISALADAASIKVETVGKTQLTAPKQKPGSVQ